MAKKPRKWSNLKGVLQDKPPESDRAAEINAECDKRANKTMAELAREYNALLVEEEAAKAAERLRNIKYEAIERQMNRWLETQQTDIWRGEGASWTPKFDIYPSVKDKAALIQWVKNTNQEDKLALPWATLKADCEDALGPEGSGELPEGVEVFLKTSIRRTKS